jgi:hypothetical protein
MQMHQGIEPFGGRELNLPPAKNFLTILKRIEAIRTAGSKAEAGNFVALLVGHERSKKLARKRTRL